MPHSIRRRADPSGGEDKEDKMQINDPIAKLLGDWSVTLTLPSVILRVCIALVLAAIIGCERSSKRHSAGLRTFILMTLSSAIAMMLDMTIIEHTTVSVPLLSAACIIGTAMLSGNSILFSSRSQIKGLTTSVGLWCCGILGLAAGAGFYTLTLIAFVALIAILAVLPAAEIYLKNRSNHFEIHLELKDKMYLRDFVTTIRKLGLRIDDIEQNMAYTGSGLSVYTITLTIDSEELKKYKTHSEIIEAVASLDYISHIEEMN